MLPAGKITEQTIEQLGTLLSAGDIIIDGGNTNWKDDVRRGKALKQKGIRYVDCGTSGGVWGLERGYCLMIGGENEAVQHLDPIFSALAPGIGTIERTPGREGRDPRAEHGYIHAGPVGAGHFVKMVHNGIEYGMMQAFAEGFDILRNRRSDKLPADERFDLNMGDIAEVWRRGQSCRRGCSTWPQRAGDRRAAGAILRLRRGFRRRPLDHRGRDRGSGARRSAGRVAVRPLPFAPGPYVRRKNAVRHAVRLRRPCRGSVEAARRNDHRGGDGRLRQRQDHHRRRRRQREGWTLLEGDKFHPPANVEKMSHGIPLTDEDRWPWLRAIAAEIDAMRARGQSAVVACSALKRGYRDILIANRPDVVLVYLHGDKDLIAARMAARKGHFMPPALLDSQFATLEEPGPDEHPIVVSVAPPPEAIADEVVRQLKERIA